MDLNLLVNILKLIVLLIICITFIFQIKNKNSRSEEFKIVFNCLDTILSTYKTNILKPKIDNLIKEHDLDPMSQTNSSKVFNQKKEEVLKKSVNDVFKFYINRNTIEVLEQYYTRDGLLLFILTYFRG